MPHVEPPTRTCPATLTPRQWEQRKEAGRAAYRAMVRRALEAWRTPHGPEPFNWDLAARHLTGARRAFCGFYGPHGVTSAYMRQWAHALGLWHGPTPPTFAAAAPFPDDQDAAPAPERDLAYAW